MPQPSYTGGNQGGSAADGSHTSGSRNCTITLAVTVPAGSNFLVVATSAALQSGGTAVVTPTFNGVNMATYLALANSGGAKQYLYYLVNPTIGTYNFFVNYGSCLNFSMDAQAACFANVDPVSPFTGVNSSGTNSGYTVNSTVTSDTNSYILHGDWFNDRTAPDKTWGMNSPGVTFGYQKRGFSDSTGSPQGTFCALGGKVGAAGSNAISTAWPYGSGGTYYNINLRGYTPAAKARSQTIIIM